MSVEFFQTRMGRQFYEGTMPELVRQIARLNELLERLVAREPMTRSQEMASADLPRRRPEGYGGIGAIGSEALANPSPQY